MINKYIIQNIFQSITTVVVFNLYPIYGVFFLDWNVGKLLLLYWLESFVIALFTVIKILCSKFWSTRDSWKNLLQVVDSLKTHDNPKDLHLIFKVFAILFFTISYILAALFHFYIIMFLVIASSDNSVDISAKYELNNLVSTISLSLKELWLPILLLFINHLISFIKIYLGKKEFENLGVWEIISEFWPRNYTIQLTVMIGSLFIILFSNIDLMIIGLVIAKIIIDIKQHINSHRTYIKEQQF